MFSALNCNITNIKRVSGFDSYGEPQVIKIEPIKCKLEKRYKKITDRNGSEVVSRGTIRTEVPLGELDMIEVNGKYVSFIDIQPQDNFAGKVVYWIGWF